MLEGVEMEAVDSSHGRILHLRLTCHMLCVLVKSFQQSQHHETQTMIVRKLVHQQITRRSNHASPT